MVKAEVELETATQTSVVSVPLISSSVIPDSIVYSASLSGHFFLGG